MCAITTAQDKTWTEAVCADPYWQLAFALTPPNTPPHPRQGQHSPTQHSKMVTTLVIVIVEVSTLVIVVVSTLVIVVVSTLLVVVSAQVVVITLVSSQSRTPADLEQNSNK